MTSPLPVLLCAVADRPQAFDAEALHDRLRIHLWVHLVFENAWADNGAGAQVQEIDFSVEFQRLSRCTHIDR